MCAHERQVRELTECLLERHRDGIGHLLRVRAGLVRSHHDERQRISRDVHAVSMATEKRDHQHETTHA